MNTDERRWSGLAWAAVVALGIALPSQAHEHGETSALANAYPATSLPGEGDEEFAKLAADETHGPVSIVTMPDARWKALDDAARDWAERTGPEAREILERR